ncbi:diguanylate cyclase [Pseudomonas putida]|nr:diguanylate cyclase [Pseudomonas putida]
MGAGLPANTGKAGAMQRGACFAGKPAPTVKLSQSCCGTRASCRL